MEKVFELINGNHNRSRLMVKLLLLIFLVGDACIEPLDIDLSGLSPKLVVDGEITNADGQYEVRLYYTTRLDSSLRLPRYESGASVQIFDQTGSIEPLFEEEVGVYRTSIFSSFRGEIGKSYGLQITTASGMKIKSDLQEMRPVVAVSDMIVEFVEDGLPSTHPYFPGRVDALEVYLELENAIEPDDNVRWRWHGTYKTRTFPELHYATDQNGGRVPEPLACSGYIAGGGDIIKVAECECCICFPNEYNQTVRLSDDLPGNSQNNKKMFITSIPVTGQHFLEKYFLEVEILSLSPEAYKFWSKVGIQQEAGGNIFQPNAVQVKGNMYSTTHHDTEILGMFSVMAVDGRSRFIYPAELPKPIQVIDTLFADCRRIIPYSTTERPIFW